VQLIKAIPEYEKALAKQFTVKFRLDQTQVEQIQVLRAPLSYARELLRTFARITDLSKRLSDNHPLQSLFDAIVTTQRARVVYPSPETMTAAKRNRQDAQVCIAVQYHNAQLATRARDIYRNAGMSIGDSYPSAICGIVTGVPRSWTIDDFRDYIVNHTNGNQHAAQSIAIRRIETRNAIPKLECEFAILTDSVDEIVSIPPSSHYGWDINLSWDALYLPNVKLCVRCMSLDHARNQCDQLERCRRCGHYGHSAALCSAQGLPVDCVICSEHPNLNEQHPQERHATFECTHLRGYRRRKLVARARPQARVTAPIALDSVQEWPRLPAARPQQQRQSIAETTHSARHQSDDSHTEQLLNRIAAQENELQSLRQRMVEMEVRLTRQLREECERIVQSITQSLSSSVLAQLRNNTQTTTTTTQSSSNRISSGKRGRPRRADNAQQTSMSVSDSIIDTDNDESEEHNTASIDDDDNNTTSLPRSRELKKLRQQQHEQQRQQQRASTNTGSTSASLQQH